MNADRQAQRAALQASAWIARLESGSASEADREQHARWLQQSELHRAEYAAARRLWLLAGKLDDLADGATAANRGGAQPSAREAAQARAPRTTYSQGRSRSLWALAASVVLMLGIVVYLMLAPTRESVHETVAGERRELTLPDGSVVMLNTATRLRVPRWQESRRLILESGEAFFSVAHRSDQPFIVEAAGGAVRALGTQFNVRVEGPQATVAIVEGGVELSLPARADAGVRRAVLVAGEGAVYGADGSFGKSQASAVERLVAWRAGKFVFHGATLEEVVREISRYWDGRIIIDDDRIRDVRISGTFQMDRVPELLQTLEKAAPIRLVMEPDDDEVRLVAR